MGSHRNYYLLIYHLILLKNEFHRVRIEKFQSLILELSKYSVDPDADENELPSNKALAQTFNIPQSKMNNLLKELHSELVGEFSRAPLKIQQHRCVILIHYSYSEERDMKKDIREEMEHRHTCIAMELPFIPRIGEEVYFSFLQDTGKFYYGYVHEVSHDFDGVRQEIVIHVHPTLNYFARWEQLREEHERHERWLRSIRD